MTDVNPWSISFLDTYYDIVQPLNNSLRIDISHDSLNIVTHPTQLTKFYIQNALFDQTLCTSPTSTGRDNLITQILALSGAGGVGTNVNVISSVPITANQGTSPWVSSISNFPATTAVTQSTSPWVTTVSNFPATQPVSGTVTANQGTSPWVVNETQIGSASYTLGQKTEANSAPVVIASDQSTINVSSSPAIPTSANIIGASLTATGTLATIPAGRVFNGSLSLSCANSLLGTNNPNISCAGTGVVPTGILHQIICNGLALTAVANSNTISNVFVYGGTGGATITYTAGATGTSTGQIAGRLL